MCRKYARSILFPHRLRSTAITSCSSDARCYLSIKCFAVLRSHVLWWTVQEQRDLSVGLSAALSVPISQPMCCAVRFQGDVKLPDGTAASELAVESAQTSSAGEESSPVQQVELGLLKPERQYEVTICPVAEGTQLANIKESTGLAVGINRTEGEAGEGPHVTCQLVTPREGDVVHFFSADFVDASGAVIKHRAFSIAGKVMTSDKGV